jgi:predicted ATPase
LATLSATLDECVNEGVARVVAVRGESGLGKSRLLNEFVRRARDHGSVRIFRGRVDALQDGAPFALMADVIRNLSGIGRKDELDRARAQLEARVALHVPVTQRDRVAAFLGEVASIPYAEHELLTAAKRDAVLMGDQIRSAVEDFFDAECRASPCLMVLEDAHWADLPSLRLIHALLRHLNEHPLMIALGGRPDMQRRFDELWHSMGADLIALAPLTRKASETLVSSIVGERLDPSAVASLVDKSGGNPLFIEELARAAVLGSAGLAESILGAVQARLDELDDDARRVLRAAAIFGSRFSASAVEALVESDDAIVVDRCLAELERGEVVARSRSALGDDRQYVFAHDLLCDGAYAMLTDDDRRRGHAMAGAWLEHGGERNAEILAVHYQRGGAMAKALPWLMRAAQQALDGNDFERAIERADDALGASGDRIEIDVVKAQALRNLDRYSESMACARRALSQARRGTSPWFRAATELALSCAHADAYEELERLCDEVRAAEASKDAVADKVGALCISAWMLQQSGRIERAYELVDLADEFTAAHGISDPLSLGHLAGVRAVRAYNGGDIAGYLRESERAQFLYDAAGQKRHSCGQALNVTVGFMGVGCHERAVEVATRILAEVRRLGLKTKECFALTLISHAQLELGDLDAAEQSARQAWEGATERQHQRHLGLSKMLLGRIATERSEFDAAIDHLRTALEHFESSPSYRVHTLGAMAQALLRRGDAEAALDLAEQAQTLADACGVGGASGGHIALVRAESFIALGRTEEAAAIVKQAAIAVMRRAERFNDDWLRARFLEGISAHVQLMALDQQLSG